MCSRYGAGKMPRERHFTGLRGTVLTCHPWSRSACCQCAHCMVDWQEVPLVGRRGLRVWRQGQMRDNCPQQPRHSIGASTCQEGVAVNSSSAFCSHGKPATLELENGRGLHAPGGSSRQHLRTSPNANCKPMRTRVLPQSVKLRRQGTLPSMLVRSATGTRNVSLRVSGPSAWQLVSSTSPAIACNRKKPGGHSAQPRP